MFNDYFHQTSPANALGYYNHNISNHSYHTGTRGRVIVTFHPCNVVFLLLHVITSFRVSPYNRSLAEKSPFRLFLRFLFLRNLRFVHHDEQGRRVFKKYAFNTNYRPCEASHVQVPQRTNFGVPLVNARAEPSSVVSQF